MSKYQVPADLLQFTEQSGACLLWVRAKTHDGYGAAWFRGNHIRAHRAMWMLTHGAIPEGKVIMHICDTPLCINPDHLIVGTVLENISDRQRKNRQAVGARTGRYRHPDRYSNASKPGTSNPASKLDDSKVAALRMFDGNCRQKAAAFGVSETLARKICRRELWKHVPDAVSK